MVSVRRLLYSAEIANNIKFAVEIGIIIIQLDDIWLFFFFNDTAPPEIYPLPLPAALPFSFERRTSRARAGLLLQLDQPRHQRRERGVFDLHAHRVRALRIDALQLLAQALPHGCLPDRRGGIGGRPDARRGAHARHAGGLLLHPGELRLDRGEARARLGETAFDRAPDEQIEKRSAQDSGEHGGHPSLARAERVPARAPGFGPGEIHDLPWPAARTRSRASPPARCTSTSSDRARNARAMDSASASEAASRMTSACPAYSMPCVRTRDSRSITGAARARRKSKSPGAAMPLPAPRSSRPRRICSAGSRIARVSGKLFRRSARISSSAALAARDNRAHSTASRASVAKSHAASRAAAGT